jgi:hypothetical protein
VTAAGKAEPPQKPQRYRVNAACITIRVHNGPGGAVRGQWQLIHLYQNAWVPLDAHPDDVQRLLRKRIPGPEGRGGGRPMLEPIEP